MRKTSRSAATPQGGTFAYYLRSLKIGGVLPAEGQIRVNPKYVWYDRISNTANRFRLPENTAIYDVRAGIRLGGVPPELFPNAALELSLWQTFSYRDNAGLYGYRWQPQESEHFTQKTWTRLGGTFTFWGTQQASAFLNGGSPRIPTHCPRFAWAAASACAPSFPCCCTASTSRKSSRKSTCS
jgi:hypothetical protein